jgi:8-oxo-dGTP pyrophosphatase MutT (NUDIX family)
MTRVIPKASSEKYFAAGFLFHPESRKVLLQFRGSKTPHSPNTWCFLGGWSEAEDGGNPSATWRREMHEEIGVTIDPQDAVPLCDYLPASSPFHRYIFYCEWPSLTEDFPLPEDEEDLEAVRWFALEDALALPTLLTNGTRRDLLHFQERLGAA